MRGRTLLIACLLTAAYAGQAAAGIADTEHNLSAQVGPDNDEVCVYCHTPHGSRSDIEAPLWNKQESPGAAAGYTSYSSTNIDGEIVAVGSVSIACLTCHDGTQATDSVINAPGMGLNPSGLPGIGEGEFLTGIVNLADGDGDLSNDHPIGVQYGGWDNGSGIIDPDFKVDGTGLVEDTINGGLVWWVDTADGTDAKRDKSDMILYTRSDGTSGNPEPFVECATCHDPHMESEAEDGTGNSIQVNFLRMANAGSAICLACHVK